MSQSVIDSVEGSFKSLVAKKPYRSVTVKEICEGAFISRRTFYANFIDKRAVVSYLFKRDAIEPVTRVVELLPAQELKEIAPIVLGRYYQGISDEGDYYASLVKPMAGVDPTFELVVARATFNLYKGIVLKYNPAVDKTKLRHVVYYHAAAQSLFLEKWICDGFETPAERLGEIQAQVILPSLDLLLGDARMLA